jgi:hypothetical protein
MNREAPSVPGINRQSFAITVGRLANLRGLQPVCPAECMIA